MDMSVVSPALADEIKRMGSRIEDLEAALREARSMLRSCAFDDQEDYVDKDLKASWERGLAKIDAALDGVQSETTN